MIRGWRLSRGSTPCRKKVVADGNATEEYIKGINEHMEIENMNMHTSKPSKTKGKGCRVRLFPNK